MLFLLYRVFEIKEADLSFHDIKPFFENVKR